MGWRLLVTGALLACMVTMAGFNVEMTRQAMAYRNLPGAKAVNQWSAGLLSFWQPSPQVKAAQGDVREKSVNSDSGASVMMAPGLFYRRMSLTTGAGPVVVDILEADLREPGLMVKPHLAGDDAMEVQTVSRIAAQEGAIAAINGGYFTASGDTLGALVIDGEMASEPILHRTVLALGNGGRAAVLNLDFSGRCVAGDGRIIPVHGVNRSRGDGEILVYTPVFGDKTATMAGGKEWVISGGRVVSRSDSDSDIPADGWVLSADRDVMEQVALETGDVLQLDLATTPNLGQNGWFQVLGGGPRLVADGRVKITSLEESFRPDVAQGRAPRTAVGLRADGTLVAVTVSGRQNGLSVGMTLEELAQLLLNLGCTQGLNLDGGGSSVMVIRNRVFNYPSDGQERAVGSALLFFSRDYGPLTQ